MSKKNMFDDYIDKDKKKGENKEEKEKTEKNNKQENKRNKHQSNEKNVRKQTGNRTKSTNNDSRFRDDHELKKKDTPQTKSTIEPNMNKKSTVENKNTPSKDASSSSSSVSNRLPQGHNSFNNDNSVDGKEQNQSQSQLQNSQVKSNDLNNRSEEEFQKKKRQWRQSQELEPSQSTNVSTSTFSKNEFNDSGRQSLPSSIYPWKDNKDGDKYTEELLNAGYTSVKLIATATRDEIAGLTPSIPQQYIERLIENAKDIHTFNFETATDLLRERKNFQKITTNCYSLDKLLGGGIEPRSVTEIYGGYTTGKTQVCKQLSVNTALPKEFGGLGGEVIYIDTEGSFRPERIVQLLEEYDIPANIILDRIFVGVAQNTNIQMELANSVLQFANDRNLKLLIVDSLTSNFRTEYTGSKSLIERQQKLNQHLSQLSRIANMLNIPVVVTNQVMADVDSHENEVIAVGGNVLAHGTTHRIQFTKSKNRSGVRFAQLIASPSLPESKAIFKITQTGINDVKD